MDNLFYNEILSILKKSDIRLCTTEIRPVKLEGDLNTVFLTLGDALSQTPTRLSKVPVISCLIIFTLFDAYLENKYDICPGKSFKQKYDALQSTENLNMIEKECYRLMKTIRNTYVHNLDGIISENASHHFSYTYRDTTFCLDISSDKLHLLYSIILYLVKGTYEVNTKGHFENAISTLYDNLQNYINREGNFNDDIKCYGSSILLSGLPFLPIKTGVRYRVKNPDLDIGETHILIKSILDKSGESCSTDYCIRHGVNCFIVPQEALDTDHSLPISELSIWKCV